MTEKKEQKQSKKVDQEIRKNVKKMHDLIILIQNVQFIVLIIN